MTTLTLDDVCHSYGRHRALDHVSSTIGTGVCGLIGENGAGKSTLLGGVVALGLAASLRHVLRRGDNRPDA